jgi:hypothetical protein
MGAHYNVAMAAESEPVYARVDEDVSPSIEIR